MRKGEREESGAKACSGLSVVELGELAIGCVGCEGEGVAAVEGVTDGVGCAAECCGKEEEERVAKGERET